MRDIILYLCDTCDRTIQLARKPKSIETIGKCIITQNCRGRLHVDEVIQTTSSILQRTEDVAGLSNFFPRNKLFKFTQSFSKDSWVITHNLESFPIISVFDANQVLIPDTEFTTELVNQNTVNLNFDTPRSGTAELYVRELAITANTPAIVDIAQESIQVSTNLLTGTMAFAMLEPAGVDSTITLRLVSPTQQVQTTRLAISNSSANSPWSNTGRVVYRNRSYYVGIVDFFSGGFNTSLISSGTTITVLEDNVGAEFLLLANSPFERADLIRDRIIEIETINANPNTLFFDNDEVFCNNVNITRVFPRLMIT